MDLHRRACASGWISTSNTADGFGYGVRRHQLEYSGTLIFAGRREDERVFDTVGSDSLPLDVPKTAPCSAPAASAPHPQAVPDDRGRDRDTYL